MTYPKAPSYLVVLPAALAALMLSACGGSPAPEEKPVAETPAAEVSADEAAAQRAAKEEELKQREAELALKEKEAELAQREAALASKEQAAKKPASTTKSTTAAATTPAKSQPAAAPKPLIVPAGTKLSAELVTPVTTKTNRRGDRIEARVISDVVVDGKVAVPTGTILSGTVTERVSGSNEIGATPKIVIAFDTLSPDADHAVSMSASLVQTGKSEGGKDTAKIAGGAVAGAIIGKQVADDSQGAVIGGLLGAAAGTAAAKNTGNEVDLPAGTVISVTLDHAVEMKP